MSLVFISSSTTAWFPWYFKRRSLDWITQSCTNPLVKHTYTGRKLQLSKVGRQASSLLNNLYTPRWVSWCLLWLLRTIELSAQSSPACMNSSNKSWRSFRTTGACVPQIVTKPFNSKFGDVESLVFHTSAAGYPYCLSFSLSALNFSSISTGKSFP